MDKKVNAVVEAIERGGELNAGEQMTELKILRRMMKTSPAGPCGESVKTQLIKAWDEFSGSRDSSMEPYKLRRAKNLHWKNPCITFDIERHGAYMVGSSRAEIQQWTVDLDKETACFGVRSYRQLQPMDKRLDTKKIAYELREKMKNGKADSRLKYKNDGVKIIVGQTITAENKQTLQSRRKRFRRDMQQCMSEIGWREVALYKYQKSKDSK